MWYKKCRPVPWQPPAIAFQIVWPSLYVLYGLVLFREQSNIPVRNLLLIGLALNLSWVPIYIYNVQLALLILTGMVILGIQTVRALMKSNTISTALFAPYLGWICFAWTLNAYLAVTCGTNV